MDFPAKESEKKYVCDLQGIHNSVCKSLLLNKLPTSLLLFLLFLLFFRGYHFHVVEWYCEPSSFYTPHNRAYGSLEVLSVLSIFSSNVPKCLDFRLDGYNIQERSGKVSVVAYRTLKIAGIATVKEKRMKITRKKTVGHTVVLDPIQRICGEHIHIQNSFLLFSPFLVPLFINTQQWI